ncbi:MAG: N-acyl-D-amino-acid deacylase family protein [Cyclobacteriaceae bacterium]
MKYFALVITAFLIFSCSQKESYDLLITNALVYDGGGQKPFNGAIGVRSDTLAYIGDGFGVEGVEELDLEGLAIAPGFINMLSWANVALLEDGRSMSDIKQGVTLEVLGEGRSMGPWNPEMKLEALSNQTDIKYEISWTTLSEYLSFLEKKGVSTNVTSFVGNGTLRQHVIGYEDRPATAQEIQQMQQLLEAEMQAGAVGVSSSLLYAPSSSADTEELIALAKVAAKYDGMYISHIRNEGDQLLESIDELIQIARSADISAEVYHLKASGQQNWNKMDTVFAMIEEARAEGLNISADMYTYPASSTGLHVQLPDWVREGGVDATIERLSDASNREKILSDIAFRNPPETIMLVGFKKEELRVHAGKYLTEYAEEKGKTPSEAMIDLIVEDDSRVQVVYFSMSEENINKKIQQSWMSFCSDAGSMAAEGVFLKQSTHPRAYGSFIRVLGEFARERGVISLEDGIRRLSALPAENLKLQKRGYLRTGYFADLVVFDPELVSDKATFEKPHQYAEGIQHVWVNGIQVLKNGVHTGNMPGRFVKGPGFKQ